MFTPEFYRYFLGCRPEALLHEAFQRIAHDWGWSARLNLLHFTFCVIAEQTERDAFLPLRVQSAFRGWSLHSFPINLSRVVAGPNGAEALTFGRQDALQDFYRMMVRQLRAADIKPLHRKSGLRPHVTLEYGARRPTRQRIALEWFPTELLLIESEVGLSRHNLLARWPLLPPRQGSLQFDAESPPETQSPATRLTMRQLPLRELAKSR